MQYWHSSRLEELGLELIRRGAYDHVEIVEGGLVLTMGTGESVVVKELTSTYEQALEQLSNG